LRDPTVQERFAILGAQPRSMAPEEFRRFIADESAKWAKTAQQSGARAD